MGNESDAIVICVGLPSVDDSKLLYGLLKNDRRVVIHLDLAIRRIDSTNLKNVRSSSNREVTVVILFFGGFFATIDGRTEQHSQQENNQNDSNTNQTKRM